MSTSGRIKRMVKITDLPWRSRILEFSFQPFQLLRIHVVTVQNKESDVPFGVSVIPVLHVEQHVKRLIGIVMVPQCCVELHASIKQRLIGKFELLCVRAGTICAVDIISKHNDKLEWELLPVFHHSVSQFVLSLLSPPRITHDP